jgi:phage baseplate assembly protein W
MSITNNFLGRGWSFPPEFDANFRTKTVKMVQGHSDIEQSIHIILSTNPGERIMLPGFGCPLQKFVFKPLTTSTQTLIEDAIRSALMNYEPRIIVNEVASVMNPDKGRIDLHVYYTVIKTNTRSNLVFPFCKIEGTLLDLPESPEI